MKNRHAFTLVELLTVIVIIGILAAIITVAVAGAFRASQIGRIGVQMSQTAMALDRYNSEFGEFPPDMFDDEALVRHDQRRWPRMNVPDGWNTWTHTQKANFIRAAINTAYNAIPNIGVTSGSIEVNFGNLPSHQPQIGALALWLGGFPNSDGIMSGFSADPLNPFFLAATSANTIPPADRRYDGKVFIDLELGNNKNVRMFSVGATTGGVTAIVPVIGNEIRGAFVPIVYFRGRTEGGEYAYRIGGVASGAIKHFNFPEFGLCVPYMETETPRRWHNPTRYQLIHPGLDGKFSIPPGTPPPAMERITSTGVGIGLQDLDNLTNFSDNRELRSILP